MCMSRYGSSTRAARNCASAAAYSVKSCSARPTRQCTAAVRTSARGMSPAPHSRCTASRPRYSRTRRYASPTSRSSARSGAVAGNGVGAGAAATVADAAGRPLGASFRRSPLSVRAATTRRGRAASVGVTARRRRVVALGFASPAAAGAARFAPRDCASVRASPRACTPLGTGGTGGTWVSLAADGAVRAMPERRAAARGVTWRSGRAAGAAPSGLSGFERTRLATGGAGGVRARRVGGRRTSAGTAAASRSSIRTAGSASRGASGASTSSGHASLAGGAIATSHRPVHAPQLSGSAARARSKCAAASAYRACFIAMRPSCVDTWLAYMSRPAGACVGCVGGARCAVVHSSASWAS